MQYIAVHVVSAVLNEMMTIPKAEEEAHTNSLLQLVGVHSVGQQVAQLSGQRGA